MRNFVESVGIAFAMIGGLFAAPLFCFGLVHLIKPFHTLTILALWASFAVLFLFTLELGIVLTGVVGTREAIGPVFFLAHTAVTLLMAPALACSLLLGRRSLANWWPIAAAICWFNGTGTIFYQYEIAESLYGIDDIGGPYVASF